MKKVDQAWNNDTKSDARDEVKKTRFDFSEQSDYENYLRGYDDGKSFSDNQHDEGEKVLSYNLNVCLMAIKTLEERLLAKESITATLWEELSIKEDFLVCYRLGKHPTEKLWKRSDKNKPKISALKEFREKK